MYILFFEQATLEMYPDILLGITNFEESIRQCKLN